jgi:hypothetical protein
MAIEFPKECSGCKKKLGSEDYDDFYSVYQCRKEHWIVCCKVDCQRLLDKRCSKVSEGVRKMQHKLNNDGHTSALRRLPPCEREKLKQYQEAENNNLLICPIEAKASASSVPFCAHAMDYRGGYGKQTPNRQDPQDEEVDEDTGTGVDSQKDDVSGSPLGSDGVPEIVNDDMLMVLKKDDEDADETPAAKNKKAGKNKSQKKQKNIIPLDFRTSNMLASEEVYEAISPAPAAKVTQPAAWFTDPSTRNINGTAVSQAWNAASNDRRMQASSITPSSTQASPPPQQSLPPNWKQLVSTMMSTIDCSETKARELLEKSSWNLERAADAFYSQEATFDEAEAKPKWGPRAGSLPGQGQPQQADSLQVADPDEGQRHAEDDADQPPAPSQPPPPPLPPNWQAVYDEAQNAYYFWHVPTNHTTWDPPKDESTAEEDDSHVISISEQARQQAEEDSRAIMVEQVSNETGLSMSDARELLESRRWSLQHAMESHNEKVAEERRARELEAQRQKELEEAQRERQRRVDHQLDRYPRHSDLPAHCVCNQHWRSQDHNPACIRLLQGEQVTVSWMDGNVEGWVYGNLIDDEKKSGYFPRAILDKVRRAPSQHSIGDMFEVREKFKVPDDLGGYLHVEPGDKLKVLHPLDPPYVWVWAEIVSYGTRWLEPVPDGPGWVPEDILCFT